ncbi:hypothetical protein OIU34_17010 [Pararhizobium sp. BT-229]|uniref:hypothetical protein n=1 Tax=Pararhizobium sp. BT-229 TaxID=2986923 RepID=UPI0021F7F860|nr:hypothetical protein [Pararhizobium sp. BT-229]MCV9963601.1 hypothetical protein [Pararhizobium sp. BT-229]
MKTFGNISLAIIIGCMPVLAGCETTSSDAKKNTVSINKGNFQSPADAKIGNDIKSILAQGGLDANNPAATPTAIAKADDTPKTLSTTATDLQTLVAQLAADNSAAQTPATVAQPAPSTGKTTALALAEQPKQTKAQTQIVTTTETTTFAPIGTPGELIPIVPAPEVAVQVPDAKPKPAPRATNKTRRVVAEAENSYKSPTVKRF